MHMHHIDVSEYSNKTIKISDVTDIEHAAASLLPKCIDDLIPSIIGGEHPTSA